MTRGQAHNEGVVRCMQRLVSSGTSGPWATMRPRQRLSKKKVVTSKGSGRFRVPEASELKVGGFRLAGFGCWGFGFLPLNFHFGHAFVNITERRSDLHSSCKHPKA